MRRYRVFSLDFDFRANQIKIEINPSWEPEIQEHNAKIKQQTIDSILQQFGNSNGETKIRDFTDFGVIPPTVVAFHNKFLRQIRGAFVSGAYYPALTAATALGERILNHLILHVRGYYKDTPRYKEVYAKCSFQDWEQAIKTLEEWGILLPDVAMQFRVLAEIRNRKAIHFNPETDKNERDYALEAIRALLEIVGSQFSAFGPEPWFIEGVRGASFIKKEAEELPFIKFFYRDLPNCVLVTPYHVVDFQETDEGLMLIVKDDYNGEDGEITDEKFVELYNNNR